jgi:hypothetical protein
MPLPNRSRNAPRVSTPWPEHGEDSRAFVGRGGWQTLSPAGPPARAWHLPDHHVHHRPPVPVTGDEVEGTATMRQHLRGTVIAAALALGAASAVSVTAEASGPPRRREPPPTSSATTATLVPASGPTSTRPTPSAAHPLRFTHHTAVLPRRDLVRAQRRSPNVEPAIPRLPKHPRQRLPTTPERQPPRRVRHAKGRKGRTH